MMFEDALRFLRNGLLIRRKSWEKGTHTHTQFIEADDDADNGVVSITRYFLNDENKIMADDWTPTIGAILANDWEIAPQGIYDQLKNKDGENEAGR